MKTALQTAKGLREVWKQDIAQTWADFYNHHCAMEKDAMTALIQETTGLSAKASECLCKQVNPEMFSEYWTATAAPATSPDV